MKILEAMMLVCWGISWPVNIKKSLTSKSTKGKSLGFMVLIFIGYIFAVANKLLIGKDYVLYFYLVVMVMVFIDICLYFRNRALEKLQERREAKEKQ